MQGLIGELSELIVKIKEGSATQGEIEAFASAAAQLNERAIVLRYKSYEAKVFGKPMEQPVHVESHNIQMTEPIETVAETPVAEEMVTTEAAVEMHEPDISFALFEEAPEVNEPKKEAVTFAQQESDSAVEGFDLFSMDDEEDESASMFIPAEEPAAPAAVATPVTASAHEPIAEEESAIINPEPVIEEPVVEKETEAPVVADDRPVYSQSPVEPAAPYDEIQPQVQQSNESIHPLYRRLKTDEDSLAAKLMAVRLETLKGAFGFNERMQIVQELFQGSNDAFSEAIEALDQLESKNEARRKVSSYANRFDWDERSDLVMEFVQKVERRYA